MLQNLVETLAAIEHDRWAHWQRYLHSRCERTADGCLIIPADLVEKWEHQIVTSYDALSDSEKESDREQVGRYLPLVLEYFRTSNNEPSVAPAAKKPEGTG